MKRLAKNPRVELAEWVREILPIQMARAIKEDGTIDLVTEYDMATGQRVLSTMPRGGRGRRGDVAVIVPTRREISVYAEDFFNSPTVVHALYAFLAPWRAMFEDYKLTEYGGWPGGTKVDRIESYDTGYTVGKFLDDVKLVREETIVRSRSYGGEETGEPRTFEYLALMSPQEMTWYHATLRENLDSIATYGLSPSRLGEGRREGWSPGWNMHLQNAVYLTSSLSYAVMIAWTMSVRTGQDAAVISIDGAGLEDTKLLTYDEDALRDEIEGNVQYGDFDPDFPQWVTSAEHRVRSVAYQGRIPPSAIKLVAIAKFATEEVMKPYGDPDDPEDIEHEVDIRWVGLHENEIASGYGRPLKEAVQDLGPEE